MNAMKRKGKEKEKITAVALSSKAESIPKEFRELVDKYKMIRPNMIILASKEYVVYKSGINSYVRQYMDGRKDQLTGFELAGIVCDIYTDLGTESKLQMSEVIQKLALLMGADADGIKIE